MRYTGSSNGAAPTGGEVNLWRYIFQRENMQSVCFTGNMLREHGKVQGLPTA